MRAKKIMFAAMAISGSLGLSAQGAANLAMELMQIPEYLNDATFEVLLPSAANPVVYQVTLQSQAAPADTLAPCDYLIRWQTESAAGEVKGFSAYYDGNHFRYRNNRLQEYHAQANLDPFMPLGPGSQYTNGVQCTAQFADMLPQFIGRKLLAMDTDSTYIYKVHADTIVNRRRSVVVEGVKRAAGYDQQVFKYVFDHQTLLPLLTEIETSPGSISEQLITVTYGDAPSQQAVDISEAGLIAEWPEIFDLYRESTFRAENLAGTKLPAFACQRLDGTDRYAHHADEQFTAPVILVMLDPTVATAAETVEAVRQASADAPMQLQVIYAFNTNRADEAAQVTGHLLPAEEALLSANSLMRDCGITLYPTILLVDRSSTVRDVIAGFNNDTAMVVLQKAMLLK